MISAGNGSGSAMPGEQKIYEYDGVHVVNFHLQLYETGFTMQT